MSYKKIVSSDGHADLLEKYDFDVERVDDERVWLHEPESNHPNGGEIWLLVKESDIPNIIGDVYKVGGHPNKGIEDVFDEYVKKREIREES